LMGEPLIKANQRSKLIYIQRISPHRAFRFGPILPGVNGSCTQSNRSKL
jgi:hypothetical protein